MRARLDRIEEITIRKIMEKMEVVRIRLLHRHHGREVVIPLVEVVQEELFGIEYDLMMIGEHE